MAAKGKSSIAQYNAVIGAIQKSTGVSRREAQHAYRTAKERLRHAPSAEEAKGKAVREEAAAAGKRIAQEKYEKERELYRDLARQRLSGQERRALKARDKIPIAAGPPKRKRKAVEAKVSEEKQDKIGAGPPRPFGGERKQSPKRGRRRYGR